MSFLTHSLQRKLGGSEASGKNDDFSSSCLLLWVGVWPKLAPGPLETGQGRQMLQKALKISAAVHSPQTRLSHKGRQTFKNPAGNRRFETHSGPQS
jgi:hypothetical protein